MRRILDFHTERAALRFDVCCAEWASAINRVDGSTPTREEIVLAALNQPLRRGHGDRGSRA